LSFDEELGWIEEYTAQHDYLRRKRFSLDVIAPVYEKWHLNAFSARIVEACLRILKEEERATVRHLFYRLVGMKILNKDERTYHNILVPKITRARKAGLILMEWLVDESRQVLEVRLYNDVNEFLTEQISSYYRNTWKRQPVYIIVWVEKAALQSAVWRAVGQFYVPVFPGKGYDSWPHFLEAVNKIKSVGLDRSIGLGRTRLQRRLHR